MKSPKNKKTIAVHSGNFHADDIFSVAVLSIIFDNKIKIIRTRDEVVFPKVDYVLDVGQQYDPTRNKFDHHQNDPSHKRDNGVPYATFGMVWKKFGKKIVGSEEGVKIIEEKLVAPIDADDNALEICKDFLCNVRPYTISEYILSCNAVLDEKNRDKAFKKLVIFAKEIIEMEVKIVRKFLNDHKKIKSIYLLTKDKRIIILNKDYDLNGVLSDYPEPIFVVKPSLNIKSWKVYAVKVKGTQYKNRVDLPISWANKRDNELAKITGVKDAVYCHHQRYMAIAKSKEGAIKLAELALKEAENNK